MIIFGSVVAGLVAAYAVWIFNRIVQLRNRGRNAFAQIDVQLIRRHDLIPGLVETARAHFAHERGVLEAVAQARSAAQRAEAHARTRIGEATAMDTLANAEDELGRALEAVRVRFEAYPELKTDTMVAGLMEELTTTENRIAFARQVYNDTVARFNTLCEAFPGIVLAKIARARPIAFLRAAGRAEREAVAVNLEAGRDGTA